MHSPHSIHSTDAENMAKEGKARYRVKPPPKQVTPEMIESMRHGVDPLSKSENAVKVNQTKVETTNTKVGSMFH
jgi:hypothetical protein